jgi:hypothetical protein
MNFLSPSSSRSSWSKLSLGMGSGEGAEAGIEPKMEDRRAWYAALSSGSGVEGDGEKEEDRELV